MRKIVVACGGRFEDDLNADTTTHLIAEAVGSLKHRVRAKTAYNSPQSMPYTVPITSISLLFTLFTGCSGPRAARGVAPLGL